MGSSCSKKEPNSGKSNQMNALTIAMATATSLAICCVLVSFFYLQNHNQYLDETSLSIATISSKASGESSKNISFFKLCSKNFINYMPCHHPPREKLFSIHRHFRRERHCPQDNEEKLRCLVPKPRGYRRPFKWPESKDYAWFRNVPTKKLAEFKKSQNWVRVEKERLIFPGGGTTFPDGVATYVDVIRKLVPLYTGRVRTVLDVGCGVASFGAHLLNYNILTMSIAPRDIHEAQVQLALERGLPAMIGVLSTHRLPFPSISFDMAHCSRCLINWTDYDALYLMEIDRILRPGGYWVLSGPPISQKPNHKSLVQKIRLENAAKRLCWRKIGEKHPVAIWRKPNSHENCIKELQTFCNSADPDKGWYYRMEPCITPLPAAGKNAKFSSLHVENWPKRLNSVPSRIRTGSMKSTTSSVFIEDQKIWHQRVAYYIKKLNFFPNGRYRNVMDMNAGLGSFAAALIKFPMWVMNVVPFDAEENTLGVIYDRGLIGTYMNWCEAFSTYPRTYDLIHANGLFTMYMKKCDIVDILLEIQRMARPEGAVIIRDHSDVVDEVKAISDRMGWKGEIFKSENSEKILVVDNTAR